MEWTSVGKLAFSRRAHTTSVIAFVGSNLRTTIWQGHFLTSFCIHVTETGKAAVRQTCRTSIIKQAELVVSYALPISFSTHTENRRLRRAGGRCITDLAVRHAPTVRTPNCPIACTLGRAGNNNRTERGLYHTGSRGTTERGFVWTDRLNETELSNA